jgi:bifunctional non-homologous end joining protein LigD
MAVKVEDHPLEYMDFEGVIPPGQYGAGDVIVWDWGTWEPEAETPDPRQALEAGELKFVVRGEKLGGRFVLVRTSPRPGSGAAHGEQDGNDQWLLIHKHDTFAREGWDADEHPHSVRSGRTNDDVRADAPALWVSSAPAAAAEIDLSAAIPEPQPAFIPPMRVTLASHAFTNDSWLFEVKWDGYRVEAVVRDGAVRLLTRNGNDARDYFPGLLDPPTWIAASDAIVDGEVVALDPRGRPDFGVLQERISAARADRRCSGLVFEVFDLLHLDGRSLLGVPLEERKKLLRLVLREGPVVRYSGHVETEGATFLAAAREQGLEGIVAKHRRSPYLPGQQAPTWLKVKIRPEQELVVGGWTPEKRGRGLGALVVGVYEHGALRFTGKVGSGFSSRARTDLLSRLEPLRRDDPPFDPPPDPAHRGRWGGDLAGVVWVRPELVIRAELGGWSRDGMVRQAAFKGLDLGRDPSAVVREDAIDPVTVQEPTGIPADPSPSAAWTATEEELSALAALPGQGVWEVGGQALKLTNLDKALFPPRKGSDEAPITKRELIDYFVRIAPAMLPHLADRPLNLHRFPNGVGAPGFWQKTIPSSAPGWLSIWHETGIDEGAGRTANAHLVADSVAALAWLANQAAFEVHAWTSRAADPGHPTFALIDIDPGPATSWEDTLTLARLYRTALEHLGIMGLPKTTGSRGIQVWIPVTRGRYDFAATSAWVERLSRAIGATVPHLVSWEWATKERGGRARLDYTQNSPIKTLVAPYAVRPHPGAPVSMPIDWDELDEPDLRSDRWTIRDAVGRVARLGDIFAAAQTAEQDLPPL